MSRLGRKKSNLISVLLVILGWFSILTAHSLTWLLTARLLQGISIGMTMCAVPIIIAEYSSPINRGTFSVTMSLIMGIATWAVHTMGSYLTWQSTALITGCVAIFNLVIISVSPETPIWLAQKGRYEDCANVFKFLRGNSEDDELDKMIETCKLEKEAREEAKITETFASSIRNAVTTAKKTEFYKPILLSIHVFALGQWAGINVLAPHIVDLINSTVTGEVNTPLIITSIDILRIVSSFLAVFIIRKAKRRTMLFTAVGSNMVIIFAIAGYTYAKERNLLSFDHFLIGGVLLHLQMLTVAIGSLPLPFTITGEIYPGKYRSLTSGISNLFSSINIFLTVKSFPFLLRSIGIYGAYLLYGVIVAYCLVIAWFFLPETKDRTLQEIEELFATKRLSTDVRSHELVMIKKGEEE